MLDGEGRITVGNAALCRLLGYRAGALRGVVWSALLPPAGSAAGPARLVSGDGAPLELERAEFVLRRGPRRRRLGMLCPLPAPTAPRAGAPGLAHLRQLLNAIPHPVFLLDRWGRVVEANRAATCLGPEEGGRDWCGRHFASLGILQGTDLVRTLAGLADGARPGPALGGEAAPLSAGEVQPVLADDGTVLGFQLHLRRAAEAGEGGWNRLPGRSWAITTVARWLAAADGCGSGPVAMALDLDGFEWVNEMLGRAAGDAVLAACARRFGAEVRRSGGVLAHLGADRFLAVLPGPQAWRAERVADRLRRLAARPFWVAGHALPLTATVGLAAAPCHGTTAESLLQAAEAALHHGKRAGGDGQVWYTPEFLRRAHRRFGLRQGLRQALEEGQLVLLYQPQVALDSGGLVGVEALLRWRHPQRGLLAPGHFLAAAEDSGLIVPIGEWILREVCRQLREWSRSFGWVRCAVNFSARQLRQPELVDTVRTILMEMGQDPAAIEVEVTENALLDRFDQSTATLTGLRRLGMRVVLDDFGTGFSSFSYLQRFKPDGLKIDRTFVRRMVTSADDRAVVAGIVDLAHSLGQSVIAEGIETRGQLLLLRQLGCDAGQGYLFSAPLAADRVVDAWRLWRQRLAEPWDMRRIPGQPL